MMPAGYPAQMYPGQMMPQMYPGQMMPQQMMPMGYPQQMVPQQQPMNQPNVPQGNLPWQQRRGY
jgi:hypothetical protein